MKKVILWLIAWVALLGLASCAPVKQDSGDIINPEADYVYFYGSTCPHCQELNKKLEEEDIYSKVALEKREVYYNSVNRDSFLAVQKKLGLDSENTGVPFVLEKATGEYATGVGPAFNLLTKNLSQNTEESNTNASWAILPDAKQE